MKRTTCLILGALVASCLMLTGGSAQFYPRQPPVNPYTGKPAVPPGVNPLTGRPMSGPRNPYTGQPAPPASGYNPLTGKTQAGVTSPALPPGTSQWPRKAPPVTGKAGPGLEAFDRAVLAIMDHHGIPGAALAIARNGKLIYARGFGWADLATERPVQPQTFFGLASLSKPITAMAILLLVERGKMSLDDRVLDHLKHIRPLPGARIDPRLRKVTIRHLLNHTGGWDRSISGDPVTWAPQISRVMRIPQPVSNEQFISFMLGVPLNFAPGTKYSYSNVGYMMMDEIIEKVSGQRYEDFVRRNVLQPAGMDRVFLSTERRAYQEGETRYYLAGSGALLPPMSLPMARAAGGWTASAVDMVRFLTALDGSRGKKLLQEKTFAAMVAPPPPPLKKQANGTYPGLGWPMVGPAGKGYGYIHDGNWPGTRTFMKCNPARGVNWVLLFNATLHPDPIDQRAVLDAVREVQGQVERIEKLPDLDLFPDFSGG